MAVFDGCCGWLCVWVVLLCVWVVLLSSRSKLLLWFRSALLLWCRSALLVNRSRMLGGAGVC